MTAKRTRRATARVTKPKSPPDVAEDFYGSALNEAERVALQHAENIEGLDDEIAVLRVKLRTALNKNKQNLPLMLRGIDLLVKAVSARYRLSKKAEADLSDSLAGVVRGVGGLLMPELFDPEPRDSEPLDNE